MTIKIGFNKSNKKLDTFFLPWSKFISRRVSHLPASTVGRTNSEFIVTHIQPFSTEV